MVLIRSLRRCVCFRRSLVTALGPVADIAFAARRAQSQGPEAVVKFDKRLASTVGRLSSGVRRFRRCQRRTADIALSRERTPISRPGSRTKTGLRTFDASTLIFGCLRHHKCLQSQSRPFSHSVGCEPNRARHPSGSSGSRCAAIALAACAAPEKRWCQAVSMGDHIAYGCGRGEATPVRDWLMAWAIG